MIFHRLCGSLLLVLSCVAGCASTQNKLVNPMEFANSGQVLKFEEVGSGIGSDGYVSNGTWASSEIRLMGSRSIYSEDKFEIFSYHGGPKERTRGTITVDRAERTILVDVSIDGRPYKFNGRYSY